MSNGVDAIVGGKIAEMRELRGMTLADLAAAIDASVSEIAAYERGARVAPTRLVMISRALRVSLGAFLFDIDCHPFGGQRGPVSPAEGLRFVRTLNRIRNPDLRAALLDIADYLASEDVV